MNKSRIAQLLCLGDVMSENRSAFWLGLFGFLLTVFVVTLFAWRAWDGLTVLEFADETEKYTAAQMIFNGGRLYGDIFSHHGPIPYMLAHLYTVIVSAVDFTYARLLVVVVVACSAVAIVSSPILTTRVARIWVLSIFLGLLSSVWVLQSLQMMLYHSLIGYFFLIALAQLAMPALLQLRISSRGAFISGLSLGLACFSAYVAGPAAILLCVSTIVALLSSPGQRGSLSRVGSQVVAGGLAAVVFVGLWLLIYGDIFGYFVYHFYFNQVVYKSFINYSVFAIFGIFQFSFGPTAIVGASVVLLYIVSAIALVFMIVKSRASTIGDGLRILALVILLFAVAFTNPRGAATSFHNGGFVVAVFGWFALLFGSIANSAVVLRQSFVAGCVAATGIFIVVSIEEVGYLAVSTPHEQKRGVDIHIPLMPIYDEQFNLIRSLVGENEKILAVILSPGTYIRAGRLPASGNYYYLPWQAAYRRNPIKGYEIDICADIKNNKPPVIFYDEGLIWGVYSIREYEPCVKELLNQNYSQLARDPNFFVRNDRLAGREDVALMLSNPAERERWLRTRNTERLQISTTDGLACLAPAARQVAELTMLPCSDITPFWLLRDAESYMIMGASNALCADVIAGSTAVGAGIVGWSCTGTKNQRVAVERTDNQAKFRFAHSGLCLVRDGTTIRQGACDTAASDWSLTPKN